MTILRFNLLAIVIIYSIAICLAFYINSVLGWSISLYCCVSALYLFIMTSIEKNKKKENENDT